MAATVNEFPTNCYGFCSAVLCFFHTLDQDFRHVDTGYIIIHITRHFGRFQGDNTSDNLYVEILDLADKILEDF